jgi:hypothetical protein
VLHRHWSKLKKNRRASGVRGVRIGSIAGKKRETRSGAFGARKEVHKFRALSMPRTKGQIIQAPLRQKNHICHHTPGGLDKGYIAYLFLGSAFSLK